MWFQKRILEHVKAIQEIKTCYVCVCVRVPAQCTISLQLASQQSCDGGETVAHAVDVFSSAAQDGGVAIGQAADFQQ